MSEDITAQLKVKDAEIARLKGKLNEVLIYYSTQLAVMANLAESNKEKGA